MGPHPGQLHFQQRPIAQKQGMGGPFPRRSGAASRQADGRRHLRFAPRGKPGGRLCRPHRQPRQHPRHSPPPGADGRLRRPPNRRSAQPPHLWHFPLRPGPIRPRRGPPAPGGRRPQDDLNARPAPRPPRPRHTTRRNESRPSSIQPPPSPRQRHLRPPQAIPRRHRIRNSQRRPGNR